MREEKNTKESILCLMRMYTRKILYLFGTAIAATLLINGSVSADTTTDTPSDQWQFDWAVYLWGASIGGESAAGGDIDIGFDQLWSNLNFAFMTTLAARKNKWTTFTDVIYLSVEGDETKTGNVGGVPIDARLDVEITGWVVHLGGGYSLIQKENVTFNVIAGARFLYLDTDLGITIGNINRPISGSGDIWDGFIGVRGSADFSEKWFMTYHLDVGTGESDFTWQAMAGVGYKFKKVNAILGYRYLAWDFDDSDPGGKVFNDLNFQGPYLGAVFKF